MRETNKAKAAFEDYYNMGPGRSQEKLLQKYRKGEVENPPTVHSKTLAKWSKAHDWVERVAARDAELAAIRLEILKEEATKTGYALFYKRIGDLNDLAALLLEEILTEDKRWCPDVKGIGKGENFERVEITRFNASLVKEFRETLDDIASEMGERPTIFDGSIEMFDREEWKQKRKERLDGVKQMNGDRDEF